MIVYDQIRSLIRENNMTRYRIARSTGISQAQLCLFMQGKRGLSIEALGRLANCLDLEILVRPRSGREVNHGMHR